MLVLLNLTANAVKFTPHGEVLVRVDRRDDADGTVSVCCAVQDTGIGIPAEKQAVIFEAFQQADGSTTRQYGEPAWDSQSQSDSSRQWTERLRL